jgi:hypothetical protein
VRIMIINRIKTAFHYLDDLLLLAGGGCIVRGLAMWSEIAAWIGAGVLLIALAVMIGARNATT